MAILQSPGISVSVSNESAYAAPGNGTIPLIILATRENKTDPTGTYSDGIAPFTKAQYAGSVVSVTSQRELSQYFGLPIFRKSNNAIVEGDETHEYGLLGTYSYLGQGPQAYVVRANIDLGKLEPSLTEPTGPVALETFWLDTNASKFGLHVYNGSRWIEQATLVEVAEDSNTPTTPATIGAFLVLVNISATGVSLLYFKGAAGVTVPVWARLDEDYTTNGLTFAKHYNVPTAPETNDIWVKTTTPSNGINLKMYISDINGEFSPVTIQGISEDYDTTATFTLQDGSSLTNIATLTNGAIQLAVYETDIKVEILYTQENAAEALDAAYVVIAQNDEPTGNPANGDMWYNPSKTTLDILKKGTLGWERVDEETIIYSVLKPSKRTDGNNLDLVVGDIWVDLSASERDFPSIYRYFGDGVWEKHDNTDQTTEFGVLFADIFADATTLIAGAPNHLLYPSGILAINMCRSGNTILSYDSSLTTTWKWRNAAANHSDGSGSFGRYAQRKVISVAMQAAVAGNDALREESRSFTILCAPNFPELTDELVTLNVDRGETGFVIIDAPMHKTPTEIVNWAQGNNADENGEDGLVTKYDYSAAYYPAIRTTTPSGDTVTVPSSHSVLYQVAYNDNIAYPWFAVAGLTRGIVTNGTATGYINSEGEFRAIALSQGQRDILYQNKINPIATFPSEGVVIFGNKSLSPTTSALDRVNVGRLVAYLKERFQVIGRPFLFEPNDQPTRDRIRSVYENLLLDILSKRGVTDFFVLCNASNNTPERIDRNELWIEVGIVPTKSTEFIYIPLRILNTGAI